MTRNEANRSPMIGRGNRDRLRAGDAAMAEATPDRTPDKTTEDMQRRLAAIMSADAVGYSRLMGEDDVATVRTLSACRSIIAETVAAFGGRVVDSPGDNMLAEFPSAVDAVKAAATIQERLAAANGALPEARRMMFRIGVNLGDVLVEGGRLYGDGVNVAARMESRAEPGGICVSGKVHDEVAGKLDLAFADLGEQSVKNIARPVRVFRVTPAGRASGSAAAGETRSDAALALPDKPSIAVLPFQNMSGDPEQEYFADGMVEDIITGLARINWLFVIARNSSFTYKGKPVDVKQVGRELGVRYVLEGSVRKAGNRLRITGQLIEADSGAHLWADKYDGAIEEVFDLQDKITDAVVGIVEPSLKRAEIERVRRKRPEHLGAYDLYLRAVPYFASVMPEDVEAGMALLEEALRLDPNYAPAHAFMAWGLEMRVVRGGFDAADAAASLVHARAALVHGADDPTALAVASLVVLHLGHDPVAAAGAIARALSLNGSSATALYFGTLVHAWSGDPATAEEHANRALRLSPFDPLGFQAHLAIGIVRLRERRFDIAAYHFANAAHANPRFSTAYAAQAGALAQAGHVEDAKTIAKRLLELEPRFRIRPFMAFIGGFARPEVVKNWAEGLRIAGLPE